MRTFGETHAISAIASSTTQDVSNRVQKWNVGKSFTVRRIWAWALLIMSEGPYIEHFEMNFQHFRFFISGSGRQSCEPELNYTGCEQSRSEMERWTRTTQRTRYESCVRLGKRTPFLRLRAQLRRMAERQKTRKNSQCEFFLLCSLSPA